MSASAKTGTGHVGPDDHPGQQVAQNDRLPDSLEQHRGQGRDAKDDRQVRQHAHGPAPGRRRSGCQQTIQTRTRHPKTMTILPTPRNAHARWRITRERPSISGLWENSAEELNKEKRRRRVRSGDPRDETASFDGEDSGWSTAGRGRSWRAGNSYVLRRSSRLDPPDRTRARGSPDPGSGLPSSAPPCFFFRAPASPSGARGRRAIRSPNFPAACRYGILTTRPGSASTPRAHAGARTHPAAAARPSVRRAT